jgi:carbon-monoxide dehydrogenase small subunit
MLMTAEGLLRRNPHPTEDEVRKAITGNLCRCTGYIRIVNAIMEVADGDLLSPK